MERKVAEFIRKRRLIGAGDRVLAAFSGGPDSTVLLRVLHSLAGELDFFLEALHIHHRLRPVEADQDEAFCRQEADRLGVPILVERLEAWHGQAGNLEERMRQERNAIYGRYLDRGFGRVALGHTLDDQAETVLMRLCRGAGLTGLGGMAPAGPGGLIRPLLAVSRQEVMQYLREKGLEYRLDSSNLSPEFLRNRVRSRLMPVLADTFHPRAARVIARSASVVREEAAALRWLLRQWLEAAVTREPGVLTLPAARLLDQPGFLRPSLVREALREARGDLRGLARGHISAILALAARSRSGSRLRLPGGFEVRLDFGRLRFGPPVAPLPPFRHAVTAPARITIPETGEHYRVERGIGPGAISAQSRSFFAPCGVVIFRNFRPGDRIACAGGHKKLKKLFQERQIPVFLRSRLTLVTGGEGQILWIPSISWSLCYNNSCMADSAGAITVERLENDCT